MMEKKDLLSSVKLASDWLCDIAQIKTENLPVDTMDRYNHRHTTWKGAIRGEYSAAVKQWDMFCPVWHTGQAIKSLLMVTPLVKDEKCMTAARLGAEFILAHQVCDTASPDYGLILAYEDFGDKVTTSAIFEAMHGLILLAEAEKSEEMWQRIVAAGHFLIDRLYMPGQGLFRDLYDPVTHTIPPNPYRTKDNIGGRPLLDDGILLRLYQKTGNRKFLEVHIQVSERLLADQNPPGNWIDYGPCNAKIGSVHPRHLYWWGLPLIDTYRETGRQEFLETAVGSGEFLKMAMRKDGGFFRGTYLDGKTDSFNHATSGSACAAIVFLELYKETKDFHWREQAEKAIEFCMKMQFTNPQDSNLKGAILEKILIPDGTDRSLYHIRDLGTIFFIQAAVQYLDLVNKSEASSA